MKRGVTILEFVILLASLGVAALIVVALVPTGRIEYPINPLRRGQPVNRLHACQSNLGRLYTALRLYEMDDGRLPPIALSNVASSVRPFPRPFGWADAAMPFIRSAEVLQCPSEESATEPGVNAAQIGFTDYWINSRLAGRSTSILTRPEQTFLLGDGNSGFDNTDARYALWFWPTVWSAPEPSVLRHGDGCANFLFADGHVECLSLPAILRSRGFGPRFKSGSARTKYLRAPRSGR